MLDVSMNLDADLGIAYAKSQMASGSSLPLEGRVFISVSDAHKAEVAALARRFADLGFKLSSTTGTAAVLAKAGLEVESVPKLAEGRPNTLDFAIIPPGGRAHYPALWVEEIPYSFATGLVPVLLNGGTPATGEFDAFPPSLHVVDCQGLLDMVKGL